MFTRRMGVGSGLEPCPLKAMGNFASMILVFMPIIFPIGFTSGITMEDYGFCTNAIPRRA